jgi:hypothetical protein
MLQDGHRTGDQEAYQEILVGNLMEGDDLEVWNGDGRIIFKWITGKYDVSTWNRVKWFTILLNVGFAFSNSENSGSILDREASYPNRFSCFSAIPPEKCYATTVKTDHDQLFTYPYHSPFKVILTLDNIVVEKASQNKLRTPFINRNQRTIYCRGSDALNTDKTSALE